MGYEYVVSSPVRAAARTVAAAVFVLLLGIAIPVVFPLVESESFSFCGIEIAAAIPEAQRQSTVAYTGKGVDVPRIQSIDNLPLESDIYGEYDISVIHSSSTGQMKNMQGTWMMVWMMAALMSLHLYKIFFQRARLYVSGLSGFSCELLILQEKDGKK